jgi:hypothetical protein
VVIEVVARNLRVRQEGEPDGAIPRLDLQPQLVLVVVRSLRQLRDIERTDLLAIDQDDELLVLRLGAVELARVPTYREPGEQVLAVSREVVANEETAARAKRKSFDVPFLRVVLRREISLLFGRRRTPERESTDLARCRHIAFDQRRRNGEPGGDVVET